MQDISFFHAYLLPWSPWCIKLAIHFLFEWKEDKSEHTAHLFLFIHYAKSKYSFCPSMIKALMEKFELLRLKFEANFDPCCITNFELTLSL